MTTYAALKGHTPRTADRQSSALARPTNSLPQLEVERISANRQFVIEHMPEFVDFIREAHKIGLIDGWRGIKNCRLRTLEGMKK